ncbi:MAG: membrane lipoprotein lipid attachment site-containing protein [Acidobacteriota bacterium]|nr:membrane lipoprotein lipid attachment site-containing protein [Acidobacteriota bacterium]
MKKIIAVFAALFMLTGCATNEKRNTVPIDLSLPAKLDLSNYDHIYFPGFISDVKNENFEPDLEAVNFFRRELVRENVIDVVDKEPVDLSTKDPRSFFEREQPFFKTLEVDNPGRTLALTGVVSFEVRDLSSFRRVQDETVNGRVVYRTQFVEMTGFELAIRVCVYDLKTGRMLYREVLGDDMDVLGKEADQRLAYYDLLQRVSDRVLGLFTNTVVQDQRILK